MYIPKTHRETAPGIYERTAPGETISETLLESYRGRAEKILSADKRHYEKHSPFIRKKIDQSEIKTDRCFAWAGGHPKLEAKAGFEHIEVFDAIADMYEDCDASFQKTYGPANVVYNKDEITPELVGAVQLIPGSVCNSFVHFIEHLTAEAGADLLSAVGKSGNPILIYGPNIEKAKDENWFHFRPKDHNTFWKAEALVDFLAGMGYKKVRSWEIDEDYLILAN